MPARACVRERERGSRAWRRWLSTGPGEAGRGPGSDLNRSSASSGLVLVPSQVLRKTTAGRPDGLRESEEGEGEGGYTRNVSARARGGVRTLSTRFRVCAR